MGVLDKSAAKEQTDCTLLVDLGLGTSVPAKDGRPTTVPCAFLEQRILTVAHLAILTLDHVDDGQPFRKHLTLGLRGSKSQNGGLILGHVQREDQPKSNPIWCPFLNYILQFQALQLVVATL